ncbi:MAG: cold shock and DUF1294 domain-containing protein [Chthoniobacteraceae bacterium]
MRRSGTLINWNDEKGFGFIAPKDGTDDVFLHFRAVTDRTRRPVVGDRVEYDLDHDDQKRPRAARALLRPSDGAAPVGKSAPRPPRRPASFSRNRAQHRDSGALRLILNLLFPANALGAVCVAARFGFVPNWVAVLYLALSAVTTIAYAIDKYRAVKGKWRIAEGTLQLLAMAGGWPGAFAAQRILRHKNRKLSFQVTFWLIVLAHLAFWCWFAANYLGWTPR